MISFGVLSINPGNLYRHILKYKSWKDVKRFKKHKAVDHCGDVPNNLTSFRKRCNGKSGIYKITFLPFRIFTYYGSSCNLGIRFKYHYFNGAKQINFLVLFLKVFGWSNFSITVVEVCSRKETFSRENWYLSRFQPLLNVLTSANVRAVSTNISMLTRSKISASLTGRKDTKITRARKSKSRI